MEVVFYIFLPFLQYFFDFMTCSLFRLMHPVEKHASISVSFLLSYSCLLAFIYNIFNIQYSVISYYHLVVLFREFHILFLDSFSLGNISFVDISIKVFFELLTFSKFLYSSLSILTYVYLQSEFFWYPSQFRCCFRFPLSFIFFILSVTLNHGKTGLKFKKTDTTWTDF